MAVDAGALLHRERERLPHPDRHAASETRDALALAPEALRAHDRDRDDRRAAAHGQDGRPFFGFLESAGRRTGAFREDDQDPPLVEDVLGGLERFEVAGTAAHAEDAVLAHGPADDRPMHRL